MATRTDKIITKFEAEDKLTPTQKKVGDGFDKNSKQASNFKGAIGGATQSLVGLAAQLGVIASIGGIAAFGAASIRAASDAEEIQNKFSVVFAAVEEEATQMADTLAENYGLARAESQNLLSATGDLLTGFGFSDDAALGLSNQVQELSVDLASFNNLQGGASQASEIITKALLGERDALTTLGVKVSEADVQNRLLAEGKSELTGNALLAAKAEATFALIMEQTGKAQGDFARSSESAANKQRVLQARFSDLQVEIGNKLLPIWNDMLSVFLEVIPVIAQVVEEGFNWLSNVITTISDFVNNNAELVKALLIGLGTAIAVFLVPAFIAWAISAGAAAIATIAATLPILAVIAAITLIVAAIYLLVTNFDVVKEAIGNILTGIFDGIKNIFNGIAGFIGNVISGIRDFVVGIFTGIRDTVVGIINGIRQGFENAFNGVKTAAENIFNGVVGFIKNIINGFIDIVNGFVRGVNDILDGVDSVSSVVGINVDFRIGEIPKLQTGTNFFPGGAAIINEIGPETAILPRGTKVKSFEDDDEFTVGEGGGRGTTINNYNTFYEKVNMNRVANKLAFQLDN